MRSVHFDVQGFTRTYWDFFSAFGLFFSVFLSFAAVLAWLLGGLPAETLARVRGIAWALAICFLAVTALSWRYAFTTPIVFSTLITVCLIAAANSKPRLRGNQGLWLGEVQQHHIRTLLHSFEDDFTTIWRDVEVANVEVGSEMVRAGRGVMRQMSNLSGRKPWTK